MKLFLDTEFNGHGGQLISLALVPEAGDDDEAFYEVCEHPNEFGLTPWVNKHVVPVLGRRWLHADVFRVRFHDFILQFDNPEIVCDWHADAEHFCRLLAGPDYGSSLDFACRITIIKTPPGQPVSAVPHNALEDARALRRWCLAEEAAMAGLVVAELKKLSFSRQVHEQVQSNNALLAHLKNQGAA